MRIGIYGGTFNPPHLGHLTAAKTAFELLSLDKLLLIPARVPPHKNLPDGSATAAQRLQMTRLAGDAIGVATEVLELEIARKGKSFTSDTLRELREIYPTDELWLLMGTDMFLTFGAWHEPETILSLAGIAAFGRTEKNTEELFARQRENLTKSYPGARIFTLTVPDVVEISSTELRAKGLGMEKYLPPAVYGYILREGLYGTGLDLRQLTVKTLRPIALSYLKHKRIAHVLGTEGEAVRLTERYGGDETEARVAALLHDCTKKLTLPEQLALCEKYEIDLDEVEQTTLKLLHAKTGAALARAQFGVSDAIYNAILWHTTGRANMTKLEKIIYLADYIEPTRDFPGVAQLRRVSYEDLDAGVRLGLQMTIEEMESLGTPVHRNTKDALGYLKGQREDE